MIRILKPGILDTFQDHGRFGFAKWGVNTNGAMDSFAFRAANALVANDLDSCVLEMHYPAPEILFLTDSLISLTGADFSPAINGKDIASWKSIQVPAGTILNFTKKVKGARCYLSVHGGFDIPKWLGSTSTNVKSKTGGLQGRSLRRDDEVKVIKGAFAQKQKKELIIFPWSVSRAFVYDDSRILTLRGKEWSWMDEHAAEFILTTKFSIESTSDRMASFLRHEGISFERREQLLSSAVDVGTIQALPSGKLCVLMADHQTTGGYPRVAHIISAHLPKFSQLSPGEFFTFSQTTVEEAEKMLFSLQHSLLDLKKILQQKLSDHYGID